ncbi:hypothetical protein [Comamonas sp. JC664]|uniref:hypothetical protein n=1 Tax=Comamonas sp. JC664 TaxID=2801917 RepID=UPI003608E1DF
MHALNLYPLSARGPLPRRTMTLSALAATLLLSGCALPPTSRCAWPMTKRP